MTKYSAINLLLTILCTIFYNVVLAQNPAAIVEFESQNKGLLMPRMDSMQRNSIQNPPEGLMVYDLSLHAIYFYNGTDWSPLNSPKESGPFIGEIRLLAGPTVPSNWRTCDGSLLLIADHPLLFAEIGSLYGGNGSTDFALPDLRGRAPIGAGQGLGLANRTLADAPGEETTILDVTQMPSHNHHLRATNSAATQTQPAGNILATGAIPHYLNASTSVIMGNDAISNSGSGAPHNSMQPSLVIHYIIYVGE